MTIEETREKLLTDNAFVLSEIDTLITYYELKHIQRWGFDSAERDEKESVAEHVYGMHILADYFLPLYPGLDELIVHQLITWHDMSEALVDDMTTISKTEEHIEKEKEAERQLVTDAPQHLIKKIRELFLLYNAQDTPEAKFVKAIDKAEPVFHVFFLTKVLTFTEDFQKHDLSTEILERYHELRQKYFIGYELINHFCVVMKDAILDTNYIHPEAR